MSRSKSIWMPRFKKRFISPWRYFVGDFTPKQIPPAKLWSWWDASNINKVSYGGGFASQINDQSIYGRHLTSDIGSEYPGYGTRKINNRLVLDFDGIDDYMNHLNYPIMTSGNFNLFYVSIVDTHSGSGSAGIMTINNALNNFQMDAGSTTEWRHTADINGSSADISGTTDLLGQLVLVHLEFDWDNKTVKRYVNGIQDGVTETYLAKLDLGEFRIARNRGSARTDCGICEIIVTDGNTYKYDITTYMMNGWGVV